jgi:hypothetical protein
MATLDFLQHVLKLTDGALFARLDVFAKLTGQAKQTCHNQISHGTFPLPLVRVGKFQTVRVCDLARYLETGETPAPPAGVGPAAPKKVGRPRKYGNLEVARAAKAANDRARAKNKAAGEVAA